MPLISVIAHHFGTNVSLGIVGGEVDMADEEFINQTKTHPRATRCLRSHCKKTIARLSREGFSTVTIDALFDGVDYECSLSRTKLEDLSVDQMSTVEKYIKDKGFDKQDVHHVFILGKPSESDSRHRLQPEPGQDDPFTDPLVQDVHEVFTRKPHCLVQSSKT